METRETIQSDAGRIGAGREMILFVSASAEDARILQQLLDATSWVVVNVPDLSGARAVLEKQRLKLVVCDVDIEGQGSWRDLLNRREDLLSFAVVVVSRSAGDALRAEVLELGGFDLLRRPFIAEDVQRVIKSAVQESR